MVHSARYVVLKSLVSLFLGLTVASSAQAETDCLKGLMVNEFKEENSSKYASAARKKLCSLVEKGQLRKSGIDFGIDGFDLGFSDAEASSYKSNYCDDGANSMNDATVRKVVTRIVPKEAYEAYVSCLDSNKEKLGLQGEVINDTKAGFTLSVIWLSPVPDKIEEPRIEAPGLVITGPADCSPERFSKDLLLKHATTYNQVCARTGSGTVMATLATSRGDVSFNIRNQLPVAQQPSCEKPPNLTDPRSCFHEFVSVKFQECIDVPNAPIGPFLECQRKIQQAQNLLIAYDEVQRRKEACKNNPGACGDYTVPFKTTRDNVVSGARLGGRF